MSQAIFPVLPGIKWDVAKVPRFSTKIQTASSGKELRSSFWSYPIWQFKMAYEVLRDDVANNELKTLMGFFLQRQGKFDSFLYSDPSDNAVTGQALGAGNGVLTTFQLVRSLGGFVEPMKNINGTPTIKLDGVTQGAGWSVNSAGLVTFNTPPANGIAVTADFSYYFRCRFIYDEAEFSQFMKDLWELKKMEMVSLK